MREGIKHLATIFSASSFRRLAVQGSPEFLREIVDDAGRLGLGRRMRVRLLYERAYQLLMECYRIEYVYKNAITQQLLLKQHTLDYGAHSARLLTEFDIGDVRADVAVINGTSTVYEVKTSYDTLDRLSHQLSSYSRIFDKIYVVTSEAMVDLMQQHIPTHVGIMVLNEEGTLVERAQATSNKSNIDLRSAFLAMREHELKSIATQVFGISSTLPHIKTIKACWEGFRTLSPESAHEIFIDALRKRSIHWAQKDSINAVPDSLKHLALAKNMNVKHWRTLLPQLDVVI